QGDRHARGDGAARRRVASAERDRGGRVAAHGANGDDGAGHRSERGQGGGEGSDRGRTRKARLGRGAGDRRRRTRAQGRGELQAAGGSRSGIRQRGVRRNARRDRRWVAAAQRPDRPNGTTGEPAALCGGGDLGSDPASGRDADVAHDRGDQQGQGGADLQGRRLRDRGRRARDRAGADGRRARRESPALMSASIVIFLFIAVLGAGFFALNVQRLVRYMRLGGSDDRTGEPFTRLKNVLTIGIAQTKIFRDPVAGAMHATIFWGFLVITAGTIEIFIQGVFPGFSYALFLPRPVFQVYAASQDAFAVLVLAAVAFALYRRLVLHPKRLEGDKLEHTDALIILSMIGGLMVTLLVTNACRAIVDPSAIGPERFASNGLAAGLAPMLSHPAAAAVGAVSWWLHVLLVLAFLNYLPYSKHLHVATSLINVYLSNTSGPGLKGVMRPMDLEANVDHFGAADVEQLTWKNLLDGYSCTECGRCTAACPANITGKPLSPRKVVINTRQRLMEKAPLVTNDRMELLHRALVHGEGDGAAPTTPEQILGEHRLLDTYISEAELWACTSCRACVQECPVSIDQLEIINELRRYLVLTESRFPEEIQPAFESLERNGSPWAFSPSDRARWADGMDIPTMAEAFERGERPDVLFWVGCMGSFDDRAKKITVAFARIL